jgi:hypothetical protein
MLGIDIEHAARRKPHAATTMIRLMIVPTFGRLNLSAAPD